MSSKFGVIAAASALVVGLAVGGGVGGSNAQSEIGSLKDQVASLEGEVGEAQTVARESDAALAGARSDLDDAVAKLAKVTGDLRAVTAQVTEMQTAATASQTELDARAARITDLEGQLSVHVAPVAAAPEQSAPVSSSGSVWFKNCTAAREAGAAPVRVGDPGYAKHLDRDGDGIGCE
ncbi:MAG: excalibur calcium-binding domain-containing protein [Microbacterium arborescens]